MAFALRCRCTFRVSLWQQILRTRLRGRFRSGLWHSPGKVQQSVAREVIIVAAFLLLVLLILLVAIKIVRLLLLIIFC